MHSILCFEYIMNMYFVLYLVFEFSEDCNKYLVFPTCILKTLFIFYLAVSLGNNIIALVEGFLWSRRQHVYTSKTTDICTCNRTY